MRVDTHLRKLRDTPAYCFWVGWLALGQDVDRFQYYSCMLTQHNFEVEHTRFSLSELPKTVDSA